MTEQKADAIAAKGLRAPSGAGGGEGHWIFGIYLLAAPILLMALLVYWWPTAAPAGTTPAMSIETRFLIMVLLSGALGGAIAAARNYATFRGLRRFDPSWSWWYVMCAPIGAGLALILYMVLRGGLFSVSVGESQQVIQSANPFGFAALAALTGMFAKEASDKLEEIFKSFFRTSERPASNRPFINRFDPATKVVGDSNLKLTVIGRGFNSAAEVTVGGKRRATSEIDDDSIVVTLVPEDLAAAGELDVVVVNPTDKGGASPPRRFKVG